MPMYDDGKLNATITTVRPDRGFAHAIDEWGISYFIFHSAIEMTGSYSFEDLTVGSSVRLRPIDHPKGPRGIEVEIVNV